MEENVACATTPSAFGADICVAQALPTGTVTFLLADVERSTLLWESEPEAMTDALARLDQTVDEAVVRHEGVRPLEQGEGDSFVIAFSRASDALSCALSLQRAPLLPISLRIGLHTGETRVRDEHNYMGPAVNRAARLRDLAHGGQTVLSGATFDLVVDHLPGGAWLTDLGHHRLRDLARPERVVQLCHPDLAVEFPTLRSLDSFAHNLPVQLTSFIGRGEEMVQVRGLLADHRLVTLTGAGGAGKTRLALQVAAESLAEFKNGVWQVDLAPLTDPTVVPTAVARGLGLHDEPGRSTIETVIRFLTDARALIVLDNCEHLLDASAVLVEELLRACPSLTILTTSREPIGVGGEVTWRVPSLPLASDAVELFTERAKQARPDFVAADHAEAVDEICHRLDGIPLAIELAASRVRAFSPAEIVAGLHDRFRLLTGGARTAVRRQQTLRASVDWSHALLTEPERVLFRRLAVFVGGFDLDAAQAVGGGESLERHQVLDQLALLVDKSLVAAEESSIATRYRLLETVRQYALEKLAESGEADVVRTRHRDHFAQLAALLDQLISEEGHRHRCERVEMDFDNVRAAFHWSLEISDVEGSLRLASSLQPLWLDLGRLLEGMSWLDAALEQARAAGTTGAVRVRAMADAAVLDAWTGRPSRIEQAQEAITLARQLGDPALLARALTAAGSLLGYLAEAGRPYFAEAIGLAREAGDLWTLALILSWQSFIAFNSGDAVEARLLAEEGLALAERTGNHLFSRMCRTWLGSALAIQGELSASKEMLSELAAEVDVARAGEWRVFSYASLGATLAFLGQTDDARRACETSIAAAKDLGIALYEAPGYGNLAIATLAAGDAVASRQAGETSMQIWSAMPEIAAVYVARVAAACLASGDLTTARKLADEGVASTAALDMKYWAMEALWTSARVAVSQGDESRAYDDAYQALLVGRSIGAQIGMAEVLECLSSLGDADHRAETTRLLSAADAFRRRSGAVRFALDQADYDSRVAALRESMGDAAFEQAWAEGAALSIDEAVTYALRGRGERRRPTTGWNSLTPSEYEVVRLVGQGLANKEIAAQLFVSPRTVQAHLTHIYTKLGISSRVRLAQEAALHV
jgi:predicted ATPase/class 3 adenylate cyclase/DNA-binding CsgD family transcriptional regulator